MNPNDSAFPITEDAINFKNREFEMAGLTKRELIAAIQQPI